NPTLSDLIGGIQSVTLGDEEARRRRTQKSILERKAPPTFDVVIEIQSWAQVAVHPDVAAAVTPILPASHIPPPHPTLPTTPAPTRHPRRALPPRGSPAPAGGPRIPAEMEDWRAPSPFRPPAASLAPKRVYPYGLSRHRLEQAIAEMQLPVTVTDDLEQADI